MDDLRKNKDNRSITMILWCLAGTFLILLGIYVQYRSIITNNIIGIASGIVILIGGISLLVPDIVSSQKGYNTKKKAKKNPPII
jgi:uncharacterized membrane protein HdeD (DUF308 family)